MINGSDLTSNDN